jgi:catechol 2,3-dioxygenase-like lactoylglutathione lyase family enzyme
MLKQIIPVLHVADTDAATEFYCARLGFRLKSPRENSTLRIATVERDGVQLRLSSFHSGHLGEVIVLVDDLRVLHAEIVANGVAYNEDPLEQTLGIPELHVKDLDGNSIRFQSPDWLYSGRD